MVKLETGRVVCDLCGREDFQFEFGSRRYDDGGPDLAGFVEDESVNDICDRCTSRFYDDCLDDWVRKQRGDEWDGITHPAFDHISILCAERMLADDQEKLANAVGEERRWRQAAVERSEKHLAQLQEWAATPGFAKDCPECCPCCGRE